MGGDEGEGESFKYINTSPLTPALSHKGRGRFFSCKKRPVNKLPIRTEIKTVETSDGSFTLHSDTYDESYHSLNGAFDEALNKFIVPCRIEKLAISGAVNILDVGFGLGYNALTAIYTAKKANRDCKINIVSLEKDVLPVTVLESMPLPERFIELYKIITTSAKNLIYDENGITLRILTGDARESIQKILNCSPPLRGGGTGEGEKLLQKNGDLFDAVFLDPFSVKKNVELWTVDFFKELYKRMTETAILATYSASTPVRCGLMSAGFHIGAGPGDDMKKGGTLATKCAEIQGFSEKEIRKFNESPERAPFRDPRLNATHEEIMLMRKKMS